MAQLLLARAALARAGSALRAPVAARPLSNSAARFKADTQADGVDAYQVGDATNIKWHEGHVPRELREKSLGQKGCVLWFTGLSGSGKSTVAYTLEHALHAAGKHCTVLDGDNIRHGLNSNVGFSAEDREENIRRIVEVYMKIPIEVCEARDPKGLYKAARAGKIKGFTGIDDPYEEPEKPEVTMQVAKEG